MNKYTLENFMKEWDGKYIMANIKDALFPIYQTTDGRYVSIDAVGGSNPSEIEFKITEYKIRNREK